MWFLVALLVGALVLGTTPGYAAGRAASDVQKAARVLRSDESGIVFVVDVPDPEVTQQVVGDRVYDVISLPDWGTTSEVGRPQLPTRRILLGIPPDAEVELRVGGDVVREAGPYHVLPVPETVLLSEITGHPEQWPASPEFEKRYAESAEVYGGDAYYPEAVARVGEIGFIRDQRVVAVEVVPIQVNPATGEARVHTQIQVELSFDYPAEQRGSRSVRPESAVFEQILESQLLNYPSAKAWRGGPVAAPQPAVWPLPSDAFKIVVTQDGLYQLSYDDLGAVGIPVDLIDPQTFQIFWLGEEIAIRVVGEGDGNFDPGDHILFYGQQIEDKYAAENVYWLAYGQATGRRMPEQNGQPGGSLPHPILFPVKERLEQNSEYINLWPGGDSKDRWVQEDVPAGHSESISTPLQNISTEPLSATLRVLMWGMTSVAGVNPDHHAEFYVNDQYIGEYWWDGNVTIPYVPVDFPQSYLIEGTNTITVTFPGDTGALTEVVAVDYFDLSFGHAPLADGNQLEFVQGEPGDWEFEIAGFSNDAIEVYDLSDPLSVSRIISAAIEPVVSTYTVRFTDTVPTTRTYLALTPDRWLVPEAIVADVPSDLHDATNGADYIVISPADFLEAAELLANHRAAQGMRTNVVDLEDVHDEFGYGLTVPDAIQAFLHYAFSYWQPPAPTYVVLMGDGTYDPKGYDNRGVVNYLSPYLAKVDPWMGETAADNRYVSLIGDDIWPDMVLGRLPVNSAAQASIVVSKTVTYEQNQHGQEWNGHLVFVADNPNGGNFYALSDDLVNNFVPEPYSTTRLYYGTGGTCYPASVCQQQIIDNVNLTGTLTVNYIGHGSVKWWAAERLLSLNTIPSLSNASQLPIMLPMTCLDGYYINHRTDWPSLSESLVRAEDKGAVASWAPTGLGVAYGHDFLSKGYYDAVFFQDFREFGPATYMGKLRLYQVGISLEQIEEYLVMGDPALRINALDPELQIEKAVEPAGQVEAGDVLTYTLTFTNAGMVTAHDVVLTDIVPSELVSPTVLFTSPEVLTEHPGITFAWSITDLLPHTGGEVQLRAMVSPEAGPGVIVNEAEIFSPASRDVVSVTNGIQVPDLFVSKTGPVTATFEQVITYTISWGNEGAIVAPNVRLTDTLPAWVEYVSDNSGFPLMQPSPGILVWEVSPDPVLPGSDGTFEVTVQVTVAQPSTATLVNRVRIGSDLPDGDPLDDEDQWSTEIVGTGFLYLPMVLKAAP